MYSSHNLVFFLHILCHHSISLYYAHIIVLPTTHNNGVLSWSIVVGYRWIQNTQYYLKYFKCFSLYIFDLLLLEEIEIDLWHTYFDWYAWYSCQYYQILSHFAHSLFKDDICIISLHFFIYSSHFFSRPPHNSFLLLHYFYTYVELPIILR